MAKSTIDLDDDYCMVTEAYENDEPAKYVIEKLQSTEINDTRPAHSDNFRRNSKGKNLLKLSEWAGLPDTIIFFS